MSRYNQYSPILRRSKKLSCKSRGEVVCKVSRRGRHFPNTFRPTNTSIPSDLESPFQQESATSETKGQEKSLRLMSRLIVHGLRHIKRDHSTKPTRSHTTQPRPLRIRHRHCRTRPSLDNIAKEKDQHPNLDSLSVNPALDTEDITTLELKN